MSRTVETRLRKLEANAPAKRVRYVLSMTSDPGEWEQEVAAMIASGKASGDDEFVRFGWLPPTLPSRQPVLDAPGDAQLFAAALGLRLKA